MVFIAGTPQDEEMQELQQENTQLKSELQAVRERLKTIELIYNEPHCASGYNYCPVCDGKTFHHSNCWLKAELDKMEGKL